MTKSDREVEPFFSQPIRQLFLIAITLALFAAGAWLAYPSVAPVFLSNPWLNGFILLVFLIGLLTCFWQLVQLMRAVSWIMGFVRDEPGTRAPGNLLAPLAVLLGNRGATRAISASSARSILDSVTTRIEEARDITRYLANLLIFLGLLGTFYGLAITVPAVVDTIRGLAPSGEDGGGAAEMFNNLMTGLEGQLGGMGTAFASSLLGLTGSLVIGLVELFVNHGQNRFHRELEDWLSTITRLGYAGIDGESSPETAVLAAFADHMAEQMETLQQLMTESDVSRSLLDERLGTVATAIDRLARNFEEQKGRAEAKAPAPDPLLLRIAEGQERLILAMEEGAQREIEARRRAEAQAADHGPHVDAESRMRLRSIDVQLLRILEEIAAGRQESVAELRADLAGLTRVIRQASGQGGAEDFAPAPGRRS